MLPHPPDRLSGGEVFAAIFGFVALFAIFGGAAYALIRPPNALKPYVLPNYTQNSTNAMQTGISSVTATNQIGTEQRNTEAINHGLDNPIYNLPGEEGVDKADLQPVFS